jgi:hypothetical protein
MSELRNLIVKEMSEPTDEITRYFAKAVYPSIVTPKVLDQFRSLLKRSFNQYINDAINERLKTALATEQQKEEEISKEDLTTTNGETKIQTTADEMEGYYIVRAIVCAKVKVTRVAHRDQQTYFGILLDDNNRKPICRLHFNGKKKLVSFFDTGKEEKVELSTNSDLYAFSSRLIKTIEIYEKITTVPEMLEQ